MKSIIIQQTLHGYSEGHRLLDGSVKLPEDLARLMLRMSDLSGSNVISGFEEYLTGYSLDAIKMYALAKTWYAPEMPRPGCVWTHTLLIPGNEMREIPFLGALTSLFARPKSVISQGRYSRPLEIALDKLSEDNSLQLDSLEIQISEIVETLYGSNRDNILISAQTSRAYESAIFHIWSQQWPQLRNKFSFCSGALSARGFAGRPFDIQCTHPSLIREILAATTARQSQEIALLGKSNGQQFSWIRRVVNDACLPAGREFRHLLWELVDDSNLKSFAKVAQILDNLLTPPLRPVAELVKTVAEWFPSLNSGSSLKVALFGGGRNINRFGQYEEGELLAALASTANAGAFSSDSLQLRNRGRDLCRVAPESARHTISKLFRSPVNHLGEDILAGMIEAINPEIALKVTMEQPQFLPTLFRAKPELGTSAQLWEAAGDHKRELFESLISNADLGDSIIIQVVQALLESNSDFLLRRALDKWGKPAVFGTFEWISKCHGVLSERSFNALTFHVESVVEWLSLNGNHSQSIVVLAAHIVAPNSHKISHFKTGIWLRTFRILLEEGQERESIYFAALLLSLGFQNAPPDPLTLISECFETIHQQAKNNALRDDAWVILDPFVPHLWWGYDWDKCERLRRGLVEAFVRNHWSLIQLAQCISNEELLSQVLASASKVEGGREFISQVISPEK